jgi:hypothetical protein
MMIKSFDHLLRRLKRDQKGSIYIELVAAVIILSGIFIGSAVVGAKTMDFDRDARGARGGADMAWVLDTNSISPSQSDFDILGQKILEMTSADPDEDFQMYFTAVEYDHRIPGLRIDWQGSYGTDSSLSSRVSLGSSLVTVNGYDLTVRDDERLIIAEFYRTRRGLFVDASKSVYNFAVSYKHDPDQEP